MILEAIVVNHLVDVIDANKRIKATKEDISKLVVKLVTYLDAFNSLAEFSTRVLDTDLNEVMVPKEFTAFIHPRSVRYDASDYRSKDLLVRESFHGDNLSYHDWIMTVTRIRNLFKRDGNTDLISLSELRKDVTLSSVLQKAAYKVGNDLNVFQTAESFIPIRLSFDALSIYDADFVSRPAEDVVTRFIDVIQFI